MCCATQRKLLCKIQNLGHATVCIDECSICTVSTLISKVFSLSRTLICHIRFLNEHVWNKYIHTSIFARLPISILHDPCKCRTKPHAYHSGLPREGSPKGRQLHLLWKYGNSCRGSRCQESFLSQNTSQGSC